MIFLVIIDNLRLQSLSEREGLYEINLNDRMKLIMGYINTSQSGRPGVNALTHDESGLRSLEFLIG